MSVDGARNRLMEVSGGSSIAVRGAPSEVYLWTNGIYSGQYEDKYKYSADFGNEHVYGWSSVGTGGSNIGLWNIQASMEYHQGGPMKRDLMEHIDTTILNMLNSSHYGGGANDCFWGAGEVWTKVYGPYFIYCNNVTNTLTGINQAAQALYTDAQAQALAEEGIDTNGQPTGAVGAWPYYWFTNANYATAASRGTITGQTVINDTYNPSASAAGLWVGVMQQPITITNTYDFQAWMKNYQFWVKTDTNGNFTIPNVIAGTNYTLYAFGPGTAGTFQSQNQTISNSPNTFDLPATPFSVTVTAGATNNLGPVTWTPARVGATVFEIGYPSRTGQNKFRHGDDYWVSEIYSNPVYPSPIWGMFLEYPFDFPAGPNYFVGQSRWTTDWNYVQPCVVSSNGFYNDSSSTITFNLPLAPSGSASFYIALCSDYHGALEISVNGTQIAGATGYIPNYSDSRSECDTTVREGINANFSDNRINFSTSLLHSGQNTFNILMRQTGKLANGDGNSADHAMYDYIRLELTGYIPPAPANVAAYAGKNCSLVCWPVTPGATSYNLFRTTTSGSGYSLIAGGVTGPVCGSGPNNATYLDTNAANGTTYCYVVQSVNAVSNSVNSPQSPGATPAAGFSTTAPAAPTAINVTGVGHQGVDLDWNASAGANYYSVWRSTLVNNGGGASNVLSTIILNNNVTTTSYSDDTPTDGSIYSYFVTATSAGGTSSNSPAVAAVPLPGPPAFAPAGLTDTVAQATNVTLNWSAVPGAVGYVISRATSVSGPYLLQQSVTETTYADAALKPGIYYYHVTAVNAAGISASSTTTVAIPTTIVTNLNDTGPGSLRQAISISLPGINNTILFATNLAGQTITLTSGLLAVSNDNITIDASALPAGITVSGNNASRAFYVASGATNTLVNLTITGGNPNLAGPLFGYGGGIYVDTGGALNLTNCTLTGNLGFAGAALYNHNLTSINNCTFWGNNASFGGGIQNEGNLSVNNSTFTANTASTQGGAISAPVALTLNHCTISGNSSPDGGGLRAGAGGTMFNTILAGNTGGATSNLSGTITATGANLTNGFPRLAPLGNYDGPTPTMPPLSGSPAIDAGGSTTLATDQRGFPRVVGAAPDIGAVESGNAIAGFTPVVTVNSDAINPIGVGGVSLREAVSFATNNSSITFAPGLSGQTITLTNGNFVLNQNLAINASNSSITISGNNASGIFTVNSGQIISLSGLTLTGGVHDGGGAIFNSGNVALSRCTLTGNSGGTQGGAIGTYGAMVTLTNCTLTGNSAFYGGAIVNSASTVTLTDCTLSGNSSGGGGGGAIDNYNSGPLTLTGCIVAANTDPSGTAPDLWMENGPLTAASCLIGNGTNSTLINGVSGNHVGAPGSPINPLLTTLGNYGGSTPTIPPLPGSPAIDAGAATTLTTDQRGYPRPAGLGPDIGAVEGIYNAAGPGNLTNLMRLGDGSLQFSFTNHTDANFPVVATTNLSLALSNWTQIGFATETPAGSGKFQFTDAQATTNYPQRFYRVRSS